MKNQLFLALFMGLMLSSCGNTEKTPAAAATPVSNSSQTAAVGEAATTLEAFQARLTEALEKQDLKLLRPLLAETLTDGAADGGAYCPEGCPIDTFFARKFTSDSEKAVFFEDFLRVAKTGFAPLKEEPGAFMAPAYSLKLGENELYIVGKNVNIREKPGTQAKVILQKSYEMVPFIPDAENGFPQTVEKDDLYWVKIKLAGGKIGYVASKFTSVDFYKDIQAVQKDGKFVVTGFIDAFVCAL